MTPEEFRVAAHELIDWLVDRRVAIEERPVRPPVEPGDIKHALPSAAPTGGDDPRALIADLDAALMLSALDADRAFLTEGGVFTDDAIDAYIDLKMEEVTRMRMTTHPVEFDMYYSV